MKILKPILYCLLGVILTFLFILCRNISHKIGLEDSEMVKCNDSSRKSTLRIPEQELEIYNKISLLINDIDVITYNEEDLLRLLNKLRNNLNSTSEINSLIAVINEKIGSGLIEITIEEKERLNSILDDLSNNIENFDGVLLTEYEKNKRDILILLSPNIRCEIQSMFSNFEENSYLYLSEKRSEELNNIRETILKNKQKIIGFDEEDFTEYFCNIFDYYDLNNKKCNY